MEAAGGRKERRWGVVLAGVCAALLLGVAAWWATQSSAEPEATVATVEAPAPLRKPVHLRRPSSSAAGLGADRERAGKALETAVNEMAAERAANGDPEAEAGEEAPAGDATVPEMPMAAMRDSIVSGLLSCLSGDGPEVTRVDAEISLSIDDAGLASVDLLFPTEVEPPPGFAECATEVYWAEEWPRSDAPSMSTISVSLAAGG